MQTVLISFFVLFVVRQYLIKKKVWIFLYHIFLFLISQVVLDGRQVVKGDYELLEQFILLEENNQLQKAKTEPQKYNLTFQQHLAEFNNSEEFRDYLKIDDLALNILEQIVMAWLFVIIIECTNLVFGTFNGSVKWSCLKWTKKSKPKLKELTKS